MPKVKSTRTLGITGDPRYSRDCAGSARFGSRTLFLWRDTKAIDLRTKKVQPDITWSSTASWTNHNEDDSPAFTQDGLRSAAVSGRPAKIPPTALCLKHYGDNSYEKAFFRVIHDGAEPRAGLHRDGTRRAMRPQTAPLVALESEGGRIVAYSWVQKQHLAPDGSAVTPNPATTLYRISYTPSGDRNNLPLVKLVDSSFWGENEIPYGTYGTVIKDNITYLFAQVGKNKITSVARVLTDSIEKKSAYAYCVDGEWTKTAPALDDPTIEIANANAGGPGTYYWSPSWQSFVWIGGSGKYGADVFICTAPASTGPWTVPFRFFRGEIGTYNMLSPSIHAHPSLLTEEEEGYAMYLTYTKCDRGPDKEVMYATALVYVEWEDLERQDSLSSPRLTFDV